LGSAHLAGCLTVIHFGSALNLHRIIVCSFRLCPLPLLRQGVLRFAFHRRELLSARPSHPKLEGPRVDAGMREAERCTGVTNAVFGEADGADVLAERAPPLRELGGVGSCPKSQKHCISANQVGKQLSD
jgi:hypothetical protein